MEVRTEPFVYINPPNQKTDYLYNVDDTLSNINYSDLAVSGSTSNISMTWDANYRRIATVTNGWGTLTYSYNNYITNPYGTAITGGGMLHTVTNNVIANSGIEYFYDVLGRTSKREINGAANRITWVYDAMSRVTSETNALGTFNYTYVDQNASGGDRGTTRLSKIDYPNGQDTFFNYFGNSGDQRLQRISNQKSSGSIISEFDYAYDAAGQITQWQQFQNNNKLCYNLAYDQAGQLIQARAGAGSPLPPYSKEYQYSYDPAANRTGVQTSSVETIKIGGSKTTGDILTVTVFDTALSGGQQAVSYTATSTDTLSSIALNLATAINQNSNFQNIGVNANSTGTSLKIRSVSKNITTYTTSTSAGATETMQFTFTGNGVTDVVVSGVKTTGDSITLTVKDPTLSGGQQSLSYTVLSTDTLITIAAGLKNAVNSNSALSTAGITATSGSTGSNGVLSLSSSSTNVTNYSVSTSANATETVVLSMPTNIPSYLTIASTIVRNDDIDLQIIDPGLPSGIQTVSYRVVTGDTPSSVATAITALINAQTNLIAAQVSATSSAGVITLTSKSPNQTRYRINYEGGEWYNAFPKYASTQTVTIGGTATTGDTITLNTHYNGGSPLSFSYTVLSGATTTSIAAALAAAINANSSLQNAGFSASSNSSVLFISSSRTNAVFTATLNSGATETVKIGAQIGSTRSIYNNVNELLSQLSGGSMEVDWSLDLPPKSTEFNSNTILLSSPQPNSTTYSGTAQLTFGPNIGGNATANLSLGSSDLFTITVHDSRLSGGAKSISVTRTDPTSTIGWVTAQLVQAITGDADLKALGIKARNVSNAYFENSIKFRGDAETAPSANTVEFNQQLSTPAPVLDTGMQTSFTYDANGNMTSDGTNSYEWDAENRLIKITYPGTGNTSQFSFDPLGRNARITEQNNSVETSSQLVWDGHFRAEERNAGGTTLKKFFSSGEIVDSIAYYLTVDHLGSIGELTSADSEILAQYAYSPYGQKVQVGGSVNSDFQFAGYFQHTRSQLSLTRTRSYQPVLGRWLGRDPIEEAGGVNMYAYVYNAPTMNSDPSGLDIVFLKGNSFDWWNPFGHCAALVQDETGKWIYYSYSTHPDPLWDYTSLDQFFNLHPRYDPSQSFRFKTTPKQDEEARNAGNCFRSRKYKPFRCNCVHSCRSMAKAAGLKFGKGGLLGTGVFATPGGASRAASRAGGTRLGP